MFTEVVILVIILLIIVNFVSKPKRLPPGEFGYPLLGYVPPRGEKMSSMIERLRLKHGDIFTVKLGSRLVVFLCDHEMIRNVFAKSTTAGRPDDLYSFNFISNTGNRGLTLANGHEWTTNRRFALKVLKDLGVGKSTLQDTIEVETKYLIDILKQNSGKPFKVDDTINVIILNVIWGLVAGRRFSIEDDEVLLFTSLIREVFTASEGPMKFFDIFPTIVPYVPQWLKNSWMKIDYLKRKRDLFHDYLLKVIKECENEFDPDDPRHYIDMYLIDREERKDDPKYHYRNCDDSDLLTSLVDLFLAGSDTTASTLKWMLLYMAKYQKIQKQIQKELDSVVPRNRLPQLEDKKNLPYLEATIHDLLRITSFVPAGLPHTALEDIVIDNYNIPKGTFINACLQTVHHDKKYWKRPTELYPQHFLDQEQKFSLHKHGFLPFGQGRRQCLGEALAKMELFLFISSILQNFEICEPFQDSVSLQADPLVALLNMPKEQQLIFKYRL